MNSTTQKIPSWVSVLAAVVAVVLVVGQIRRNMERVTKEAVSEMILRDYGDAIQDYRSDPVRFRSRIQEFVRQGKLTQQEADEGIALVRKLSQTVP